MQSGETVGAMERVVGSAAEVFPSRCGRCRANIHRGDRAIEGTNELAMYVRVFAFVPFVEQALSLFAVFKCVWRKLWGLGCVASQRAGLGLRKVTPTVEALVMEVVEEFIRLPLFNRMA